MWLLLLKYDDRHEHSDDDLAVCEADGEDDMLRPLSPHTPWRWSPADQLDTHCIWYMVFGSQIFEPTHTLEVEPCI